MKAYALYSVRAKEFLGLSILRADEAVGGYEASLDLAKWTGNVWTTIYPSVAKQVAEGTGLGSAEMPINPWKGPGEILVKEVDFSSIS